VGRDPLHGGALIAGEPSLAFPPIGRTRATQHLHIQIRHRLFQREDRVLEIPPGSEKSHLLPGNQKKEDGSVSRSILNHGAGNFQKRRHAGSVVIGPIEDGIPFGLCRSPGPGHSNPQVIEMGAHHHNLPCPVRIVPPEDSTHIHVGQQRQDLDPLQSLGRPQDYTLSALFIPDPNQRHRL